MYAGQADEITNLRRFLILVHEMGHRIRIRLTAIESQGQNSLIYTPPRLREAGSLL